MVLRTRGPRTIFAGHRLLLHVDFGNADKVGVFYGGSECPMWGFEGGQTPQIIGLQLDACSRARISSAPSNLHPTAQFYLMHRVILLPTPCMLCGLKYAVFARV